MSFITGVGLTPFGKHEGSSSLDLMSKAAQAALDDAGLKRAEIDGILCGYSTVSPHIMLATVFAEHFGIRPGYAHAVQVGGATGLAMTMLAHTLVDAGLDQMMRQHGHGQPGGAADLHRVGVSRLDPKMLGEHGRQHDVR